MSHHFARVWLPMSLQRVFLDWNQPCLPAVAAWIVARQAPTSLIDLRRMMCVLPGARAGRLLLAHLLDQSERRGLALLPPRVLTPGVMVDELLYVPGASATNSEMLLAWMHSLRSMAGAALAPLLPNPPAADDLLAWRGLAVTIERLHEELAGQRLTFDDVAQQADRMNMVSEAARWSVLHTVHDLCRRLLDSHGLIDRHTARERALQSASLATGVHDLDSIVLIGVTDLNAVQRGALTLLADRVTAIVHAPSGMDGQFDDMGCVKPDKWETHTIATNDSQIRVTDRPEDQARAAMQCVLDLGGAFAAQQITIGLGDAALADAIERSARWAGLHTHSAGGRDLARTPPLRLLEAVADWLSERRFAHLAALLRHPDIERCVEPSSSNPKSKIQNPESASWLSVLDNYFADHLHGRLSGRWLGKPETQEQLSAVHDAVNRLLNPLGGDPDKRPLAQWAQPILDVLANVYGRSAGDDNSKSADACRLVRDAVAESAQAPAELQPRVDAPTAIRFLLADTAGQSITDEPRRDQIDMLGWLELHLDPAPALIITGFNEGAIPESLTADAFLPDSLRNALGLANNQRRYARDAYQLSAILNSRRHVTIIAGRHAARGEPLSPSRLLLACDDATLVKRIRLLCRGDTSHQRMPPLGLAQPEPASATQFVVPKLPQPLIIPEKLSVTAFKDYLNCPYRFALRWLVNLKGADDCAVEMDPLCFGSLAHDALNDFGADSTAANLTDAKDIEEFLFDALDRRWRGRFGDDPLPAVRLQIARLQQRLRSFARFQAKQRAEGWIIRHCEQRFTENNALDIPGDKPMLISGRIDRIDQHENTGVWRIMDYKTSESGESPHQTHHGRKTIPGEDELEWLDLQLPLYWHLASHNGVTGHVQLGYIVLPKRSDGTELLVATWTALHLDAAIERARQVVRDIRAGRFPINPEYHSPFDEFARICQTGVFADDDDADAEAAA